MKMHIIRINLDEGIKNNTFCDFLMRVVVQLNQHACCVRLGQLISQPVLVSCVERSARNDYRCGWQSQQKNILISLPTLIAFIYSRESLPLFWYSKGRRVLPMF